MAEAEPFGGQKALERAVQSGEDPNADLEEKEKERTRAEAGVALRLSGASFTSIAKALEYSSPTRARLAVERALASSADDPEGREVQINLIDRRLNRLLQSVMGKAVNPADPEHLQYNARALAIVDRQAKLHGVDAPTKVQLTPSDTYIQEYLAKIHPLAMAQNKVQEYDILNEGQMHERQQADNDG